MWVYNYDGDAEMRGWVYQQGEWKWGSVLTWHVTDLAARPTQPSHGDHDYVWSCYLWVWSWYEGWSYRKLNVPIWEVDPMYVYPWMEHFYDGDEHFIR